MVLGDSVHGQQAKVEKAAEFVATGKQNKPRVPEKKEGGTVCSTRGHHS